MCNNQKRQRVAKISHVRDQLRNLFPELDLDIRGEYLDPIFPGDDYRFHVHCVVDKNLLFIFYVKQNQYLHSVVLDGEKEAGVLKANRFSVIDFAETTIRAALMKKVSSIVDQVFGRNGVDALKFEFI